MLLPHATQRRPDDGVPIRAATATRTARAVVGFQDTCPQHQPHGPIPEAYWTLTKPFPRALHSRNTNAMLTLYAARIEHLGQGDFVKVDCAACHHVALLTPEVLLRTGLSPAAKVLDLKERLRWRGCGRKR